MIDIHSHLVPYVDDGSDDNAKSIERLKEAVEMGVTDMILTPHFRYGMFETDAVEAIKQFEDFKERVKKEGISVNLYFGQEVHNSRTLKEDLNSGYVKTLAGSKYVLLEFAFLGNSDVTGVAYSLVYGGYIPVIAHYERYACYSLDDAYEIKSFGGKIQINANSFSGHNGKRAKKAVVELLDNDLVDYVASDLHVDRHNELAYAYNFVKKRYGEERAQKLFVTNALDIIGQD